MKKGFTLAELIVSISIITILSVIGIQTYVTAQRSAQLKSDVITVTSAIRQAQNRALSPSRSDLTGIGIDDKLCAMGVEVTAPKTIRSYYVVEQSGACTTTTPLSYYGADIVLQSATFKSGGKFEFGLPFANNRSTAQSIQLELTGSGVVEKTITVTKDSGLIQVESTPLPPLSIDFSYETPWGVTWYCSGGDCYRDGEVALKITKDGNTSITLQADTGTGRINNTFLSSGNMCGSNAGIVDGPVKPGVYATYEGILYATGGAAGSGGTAGVGETKYVSSADVYNMANAAGCVIN